MMHIFMILVHMWPLEMFLFSGKWDFKRTLMSMNVYDSWLYFHVLSFAALGWLWFLIAAKQGLLENGFLLQSTFLGLVTLIWPPLSISSYGLLPPYRTWSSKHWRATGHISASNVCVWNTYDSIGSANKNQMLAKKAQLRPSGIWQMTLGLGKWSNNSSWLGTRNNCHLWYYAKLLLIKEALTDHFSMGVAAPQRMPQSWRT